MDAFLGYNQIKMAEEDETKTSFISAKVRTYKVIPFELQNAEATYQ